MSDSNQTDSVMTPDDSEHQPTMGESTTNLKQPTPPAKNQEVKKDAKRKLPFDPSKQTVDIDHIQMSLVIGDLIEVLETSTQEAKNMTQHRKLIADEIPRLKEAWELIFIKKEIKKKMKRMHPYNYLQQMANEKEDTKTTSDWPFMIHRNDPGKKEEETKGETQTTPAQQSAKPASKVPDPVHPQVS